MAASIRAGTSRIHPFFSVGANRAVTGLKRLAFEAISGDRLASQKLRELTPINSYIEIRSSLGQFAYLSNLNGIYRYFHSGTQINIDLFYNQRNFSCVIKRNTPEYSRFIRENLERSQIDKLFLKAAVIGVALIFTLGLLYQKLKNSSF